MSIIEISCRRWFHLSVWCIGYCRWRSAVTPRRTTAWDKADEADWLPCQHRGAGWRMHHLWSDRSHHGIHAVRKPAGLSSVCTQHRICTVSENRIIVLISNNSNKSDPILITFGTENRRWIFSLHVYNIGFLDLIKQDTSYGNHLL